MRAVMVLVAMILFVGCGSGPVTPVMVEKCEVVASYAYYPVPSQYGDSIRIMVDGEESHVFYGKGLFSDIDTFKVNRGSTVKALYSHKNALRCDSMVVVDDVRWLIGGIWK